MIKKKITFIYSDAVEKQVYEMIAEEARKRGYEIEITDNKYAKCEIGWYCQHVNHPQYSKFSVIMLHDITQRYDSWPNIWKLEPWNKYDIGFLPNQIWVQNWNECSHLFYANPRKGMYLTGWPKADRLRYYKDDSKKEEYKKRVGLDQKLSTILYAPAWENDGKQDEFVKAMLPLNVNILIKQAPWPNTYPDQIKNIAEMRELHKNNKRVIQLDPQTNILDAIMVSDILVSEESSTMCESVMMGKPAISVCDWTIPDTVPSRYPADNYEYVEKTKKNKLTECVQNILDNYPVYTERAKQYSEEHFSNIGTCIPLMMDILDSYVNQSQCSIVPLQPKKRQRLSIRERMKIAYTDVKREVYFNYRVRNRMIKQAWDIGKKLKDAVSKE